MLQGWTDSSSTWPSRLITSMPDDERGKYDRIAKVAAQHLKAPIVSIGLLDGEEMWFAGWSGHSPFPTRRVSRQFSFSNLCLGSNEVLEIEDTHKDPRLSRYPQVTGDPFVRSFAALRLMTNHGIPFGTICVLDRSPRALNLGQRLMLQNLAKIAEDEFKLSRERLGM